MKSDDLQGLLDVCLLGDANAQRLLWKACGDKLYAWILTEWSCLQDADARAIACEAFAEALLNLPKFRREVKFETWLCGIARHIAADYLRRLCLHKNDVSLDAVPEEALYRRRRRSEKSSLHDEMRAALRDVMLLVTHEQAVAVTLRFGSLLSPAVAAAQMGRSRLAFNMPGFPRDSHGETGLRAEEAGCRSPARPRGRHGMRRLTDEERCAEALAEFTDQLIAGRAPSIDIFLLAHQDIESRLRPALEAAVFLFDAFEIARRRNRSPEK